MKATVVVATYNRVDKLSECLEHIFNQDYLGEYEVIIVDDGSRDNTLQLLEKLSKSNPNLRYFSQKNSGPAKARNLGIKKAKGEYIFFTDDDVLVPKIWMSTFVDFFDKNIDIVAVGGTLEANEQTRNNNIFARYEKYISELEYNVPNEITIGGFEIYGVVTNNAAYRKKVLDEVGGFDETFPVAAGEDADLKLRVSQNHKIAYIPLIAIHIQDYGLKRFWRQCYLRGIGGVYFENKRKELLAEGNNKKKYNSKARYDLPVKMFKALRWDMLIIFMLGVLASKLGRWQVQK